MVLPVFRSTELLCTTQVILALIFHIFFILLVVPCYTAGLVLRISYISHSLACFRSLSSRLHLCFVLSFVSLPFPSPLSAICPIVTAFER